VHDAQVCPAADHLDLVPDVDEEPAAPCGPHGHPLRATPQELEVTHDVVLQEQDDDADVGVCSEAPHEVGLQARRVHGELGANERRREGIAEVARRKAQVEAHALGQVLREGHHLRDVRVEFRLILKV
jgi:hypothetical protein